MVEFTIALAFTLSFSFLCSLLEAVILSTTPTEIEVLKKQAPKRGELLERFKLEITETSAAILTLNTVVNTLGALWIGNIAADTLGLRGSTMVLFSLGLTVSILLFAEILPKNIGILYRHFWQRVIIYPLHWVRLVSRPISWACEKVLTCALRKKPQLPTPAEDIVLIAEKSAEDGTLTVDEKTLIINALSLDEVEVHQLLTPRTVVYALPEDKTVGQVLAETPNPPFSRIVLYRDNLDQCTGTVRRRDLLKAKASGQEQTKLSEIAQEPLFINESTTGAEALKECLSRQQQIAIVLDEFGALAGVLTLEDIFEHLLGQEIFEKDDVAVNMRDLARKRYQEKYSKHNDLHKQRQSKD